MLSFIGVQIANGAVVILAFRAANSIMRFFAIDIAYLRMSFINRSRADWSTATRGEFDDESPLFDCLHESL